MIESTIPGSTILRPTVPLLAGALLAGALPASPVIADDTRVMSAAAAYERPQPAPDAVIAYGEAARQFGELRLPDGDGPFPVAVVIHGGCWLADYDQGYMAAFSEALTGLGLATWTIGYRRVGEPGGGWPGTFLDAGRAADYVRVLAERFPLRTGHVIAVGHSAGGQLALWLAARNRVPASSPVHTTDPLPVHGVVALAAAADLAYLSERGECGDAATRLMGGTPDEHPARYAAGSPRLLVPLETPQILVNGALDARWSAPANRYYRAAQSAGDPVRRIVAPHAGHFELVMPDSGAWPLVHGAVRDLLTPDS